MATDQKPGRTMTLDEIRAVLSDEVERLRTGQSTAATANAVTNAVGKILSSVKLEMEYLRLSGRKPDIALLNPPDESTK